MMAITTSSSIKVKPRRVRGESGSSMRFVTRTIVGTPVRLWAGRNPGWKAWL